jgi:nicotinate-nucleotide pyrophosphorylase (carboxylating)
VDGILIKENHIAAAGGIGAACWRRRARWTRRETCRSRWRPGAAREALAAGATSVLLDNFSLPRMREAVR